jgi:hypothetical protein
VTAMGTLDDWNWKLEAAVEQIRTRYEHIGRKSAAPFLAIVYPPAAEREVLRNWHKLVRELEPDFSITPIDVLKVTSKVVEQIGAETLVAAMKDPMPGSNPEAELGGMWLDAVADAVRQAMRDSGARPVVVLERLAALYPATAPRALMQKLWDSEHATLEGKVVLLIPGDPVEPRVYRFVGQVEELMYRGDIL